MRRFAKRLFARFGFGIFQLRGRYHQDGLFCLHGDAFRADPAFRAAYARGVRASSGLDPQFEWRVHIALWAARAALRVEGDFVECGVNAGFISSAIMQALDWNRMDRDYFLIDTFAGPVLAQYSEKEVRKQRLLVATEALKAGAYITDADVVRANFAEWRRAVVVQGAVPWVLDQIDFKHVAFLHIDMNSALPECGAFEFFWHRMPPGAIVLFDDYCYLGHECQREALDAAARAKGAAILSLPTGQGMVVR